MVRHLLYLCGVILTLTVISFEAEAQSPSSHDHSKCGVTTLDGVEIKNRMFDNRRDKAALLSLLANSRNGTDTLYAPVQFHIVRSNTGTGGTTEQVVYAALCQLNRNFSVPSDADFTMEFYLKGPIRTINSSLLYDDGSSPAARYFMQQYKVDDAINVFIVNNTPGSGGFYRGGPADDYICMPRGNMPDDVALTHEFGHYFSLNHTFYGWENDENNNPNSDIYYSVVLANTTGRTPTIITGPSGQPVGVENIARSGGTENCQTAADGFCDTDPSYFFGGEGNRLNDVCVYKGTAHDPYGYLFLPSVIAPTAPRFTMKENETFPDGMWLQNTSNKDKIYPKTLIVVETEYTLGGNTVMMWQDTIGDSDTTDIYCPTNGTDNIIGTGQLDVKSEFINFGNHYLSATPSVPAGFSANFEAATSEYSFNQPLTNPYRVDMDSLRVTNTGTLAIPMNTVVTVTDGFYNGATLVSSNDRTYNLPVALLAGESYTFAPIDLRVDATQIAGVTFSMKTTAPQQTTSGTSSDNYMSYYTYIGCVQSFSTEQKEAMKLDYLSRGYANLFTPEPFTPITNAVTVISPVNGSISPQPTINFSWNAVAGATMYRVLIQEVSCGVPIVLNTPYEQLIQGTSVWVTLDPDKCYQWKVYPLNANSFSYLNAANGSFCGPTSTQVTANASSNAVFQVFDWAVGVDQIAKEIEFSSIHPNPNDGNGEVFVSIKSLITGSASLSIYNSIGEEVLSPQMVEMATGANVYGLNVSALAAGLYVVAIKTDNKTISHKLVIQQ